MFSVRFHFLLWTAVTVSAKEPLYMKIGDKAVLTPDSVVNPITSVEWKHGSDIAAEWYGDETTAYRHFKVRGSLNISNGELTITGLTPHDRGIYTVEINNRVTSKIELKVISPVPKPTLSSWCDPEMTYCVLTCNGDTTGAEPVTYRWTSDDKTLSSTKQYNITEENKELWFRCVFENPVSSSSSEIVFNPFKEKEPLYGKKGDKAVLTPDSVVHNITSIVWKHGPDIAMEWSGDQTFSYRHFKDRGSLNTLTGELTITGLTPDDSGIYTVEINNKVNSRTELLVISPVPKPNISSWCDPEMTYCVLTCNGDTTGAEPVTYWWMSDVRKWSSTKEHRITKENKELWFICTLENPVSFQSSEKVFNPFKESGGKWVYIFIAVVILVVIIIIYLTYKCIQEMSALLPPVETTSTQDPTSVVVQNTSNGTERPANPVAVQETSNQDETSTGPPETSNETEMSALLPPVETTSTQVPTSVVVQNTSNGTERPANPEAVQETSNQDETSTGPPETSNETETSSINNDLDIRF